jgi:hypothetical protein
VSEADRIRQTAITEYEYEPVPGLPERLPSGEEILWQGTPRWDVLARRAFHVRKVGVYFLALIAWTVLSDIRSGGDPVVSAFWLVIAAALAIGLLTLLARAMARSTLYTITNHRVVMRFGVALPMTVNLPYGKIIGAALRDHGDGTGDIPLTLGPKAKASYLVLWPHVRPWRFSPPEPMLRAIAEAQRVAQILATALRDSAEPEPTQDAAVPSPSAARAQDRDQQQDKGVAMALHAPNASRPLAYTSDRA